MKTFLLLPILSAATLRAQDVFTIDWSSIDGGGALPAGAGEFTITGSIGQFDAGSASGAGTGEFSLTGGYWTLDQTPMDLGFAMQLSGNTVTLTWDGSRGIPIVVERSADLRTWVPVVPQPSGPPFTDSAASRRYYRLRRSDP